MLNSLLKVEFVLSSRTLTVRPFMAFIVSDTLSPIVINLVTSVNNGLALATVVSWTDS